eukprot:gnl/TRDRNA2_/TRDRNA2_185982_c0_seq1.p1 gnl/TRDRNA2_/TRDRNA2_185982_c0~~gnl/TRDRNA2_/TRDRNA2_185982_c0_seq1.p1  ORF type:complete len:147 (+),score=29.59 gnl/TRDRNA2_/TRDRNA2_185982_c0_seq1:58-498(+)
MSVLAAVARRTRVASRASPFQQVAKRHLGDGVRGPQITDLNANIKCATEFFTKGAISYHEYKQQCVSLRLFVFAAVTGSLTLSLLVFPPKSSYWQTWSPTYWFSNLRTLVMGGSYEPIFLKKKVVREVDGAEVAQKVMVKGLLGRD